jgi:hypothetical protein
MGLKVAVANGNWSSTATWNGGTLPAAGDVVASNGFTVTIDQNVNVDSITNTAQIITTAVPLMTSDTTPSGIAISSPNNLNSAYLALDQNDNTGWRGQDYASATTQFVGYQFTSPKIIDKYFINFSGSGGFMSGWTFEGWNGSSWVVLHTNTGLANGATPYTSPSLGNTTAYSKYIIRALTLNSYYMTLFTLSMYEYGYTTPAVAGGTFNLNSGVNVTCTNTGYGLFGNGIANLISYLGTGTSTINGNVQITSLNNGVAGILHSTTGTLNVNGNINGYSSSTGSSNPAIRVTSTGVLNFTGNILTGVTGGIVGCLHIQGAATVNMIGNIFCTGSNPTFSVWIAAANTIFNLTGNIYTAVGANGGWTYITLNVPVICTINITGNIYGEGAASTGLSHLPLSCNTSATITLTGHIYSSNSGNAIGAPVYLSGASYFNQIGIVLGNRTVPGFYSTSAAAINILTGPFISADTGIQPFYVARIHYRRTMGSYFEYRDSSTGGALPPIASAPATRLVSPDTVVAAPIPANVRQGRVYALGSQVGTMIVPSPANVVKNVPVDNTVGTGVLDPSALWNVPLSAINTTGSIGQRVKNASTVESTGAQIQTTLNNNP